MVLLLCMGLVVSSQAYLPADFDTYSSHGVSFEPDGRGVTLSLLQGQTASGIGSRGAWLFGTFGAWIKLPAGNAAGTVATFYMSSPFPQQCEFDFEFLGNNAEGKRKIHTNVFVDGKGGREEQIYFPGDFDPTADFHYYSFDWHENQVQYSSFNLALLNNHVQLCTGSLFSLNIQVYSNQNVSADHERGTLLCVLIISHCGLEDLFSQ